MNIRHAILAAAACLAFSGTANASSVVASACDPVTDGDAAGCLFSGNISENPNPGNVNGYNYAEAQYNAWATANGNPLIDLVFLTATDLASFGSFGSFTGAGLTSGTFDLSGFDLEFYAVKYGNEFTLYEYLGTDGTGSWQTNGQNGVSHIAFFGTPAAVPEPGTWAMMLLGFGAIGFSMRGNRRRQGLLAQAG